MDYTTSYAGVLLSAAPRKQNYAVGEDIDISVILENTSDSTVDFDIKAELINGDGSATLDTVSQTLNVAGGYQGQMPILLSAPAIGGGHWVKVTVTDAGTSQEIGHTSHHINVNAGVIMALDVTSAMPGGSATFQVTFENESDQSLDADFGLVLYQGSLPLVTFESVSYTVAANGQQQATFQWAVPLDVAQGDYLALPALLPLM